MPCRVRKEGWYSLAGLETPAGARIRRKKEKSKIRGGGVICAPRAQHGRVPNLFHFGGFW